MKLTMYIEESVNGWRFDYLLDQRYVKENTESLEQTLALARHLLDRIQRTEVEKKKTDLTVA